MLSGVIDRPAGKLPPHWVLFAHCFTCSSDVKAARRISHGLALRGFGVLRFDFTGLGESEGAFAETQFSTNLHDLEDAAAFMGETYRRPSVLVGHSLGGSAALLAASRMEDVRAVATLGAPSDPAHVQHLFEHRTAEIEAEGEAEVTIAGRPFRIKKEFIEDLEKHPMKTVVGQLRKALLILHSPRDEVVGIDNAARIFDYAKHPKSFISLDDADHLLTRDEDSRYAAEVLTAWVSRFLDFPKDQGARGDEGEVSAWIGQDRYAVQLKSGDHTWASDEPRDAGGLDTGPAPYDLLLGALGSCTAITLRMYADRKKWNLEQAEIILTHEKRHAEDCEDCDDDRKRRVDFISRRIHLTGDLSEEEKSRLLQIADRCPVHRTLTGGSIQVQTELF